MPLKASQTVLRASWGDVGFVKDPNYIDHYETGNTKADDLQILSVNAGIYPRKCRANC